MEKGYWRVVRAKISHVVDLDFCSIPTNDANCCYLDCLTSEASATRHKPAKNRGRATMFQPPLLCLSQQKDGGEEEGSSLVRIAYPSLVGSQSCILDFLLDFWKDILMILIIKSFFPYQRSILRY